LQIRLAFTIDTNKMGENKEHDTDGDIEAWATGSLIALGQS